MISRFRRMRSATALGMLALLGACSGGGGGGGSVVTPPGGGGGGTGATPTPTACTLRDRQNWVADQMNEWYLFPETLPASLDPSGYADVQSYIDALTATARSQSRDRYFTYITSIAEENAYYNSGSSAGFGVRLGLSGSRLFITESFEGAPALAAGIDRGAEITAIGTTPATLRPVSAIVAAEGGAGLTAALGPDTVGTSRALQVVDTSGTRVVTLAKADFALLPVSSRYGAKIIEEGGQRYGYVNLRTFINTADPALRNAFALFRAQGITNVIVDFRYNGGGLVSIAELMGDLLGGNRTTSDVFSHTTFRASKASNNEVDYFGPLPQSIAPTRVAFIGMGGTASASELVINAFVPYLRGNAALVGGNTYGKPVGQIAIDRAACDDRLRVVAFRTENAAHQGDYYQGLARTVEVTCRAGDGISYQLGDPREESTRAAIDFLAGRSCTAIASSSARSMSLGAGGTELLTPDRPSTAQREVPGLF